MHPLAHQSKNRAALCPYRVLGVRRDATHAEIRLAYRRLALLNHPSRGRPDPDSVASIDENTKHWKFVAIAASFETLSDVAARRRYDKLTSTKSEVWKEPSIETPNAPRLSCGIGSVRCANALGRNGFFDEDEDLLRNDSADDDDVNGHDEGEIEPLHNMYKARNHAPFTDPFRLFNTIFHSDIFQTDDDSVPTKRKRVLGIQPGGTDKGNWMKNRLLRLSPSVQKDAVPNVQPKMCDSAEAQLYQPNLGAWSGRATMMEDGRKISKTTRIVDKSMITRTEITAIDPATGKKSTRIEVKREDIEDQIEGEYENQISNVLDCCVHPDDKRDGVVWDCTNGPSGIDRCLLMAGLEELMSKPHNEATKLSWPASPQKRSCEEWRTFLCACGPLVPE
eukprot:CAMPEP_0172507672 /NCGR_PEP_ID=MMETSP1066-20121228/205621_1 /TAXON_ID=671091 /ORGANISM="Coscinodiscus wailesii, Strain CCMP2513" /LENGTH=392 /DNA_ID=CAMNT_0013285309 /DNA_START=66 /DNA_END=1244 /DNA_ORIENTATION=+